MGYGFLLAALALAEAKADAGWRLAAVYDLTAAGAGQPAQPFVWRPPAGMSRSCGPAKSPTGLGVFEAEALAQGLSPALAVVLERTDPGAAPLGPGNLRVALGEDEPEILLQPAVQPRALAVRIRGVGPAADLERAMQLVRTQVEMELCLEHKTGRAWSGGEAVGLRQAFLLDPPDGQRPDRMFFGGQRDPVPALLGPPDACLVREAGLDDRATPQDGQGEGTLTLVPSDIWGASLRWCGPEEQAGRPLAAPAPTLRSHLTGEGDPAPPPAARAWAALDISVGADTPDGEIRVSTQYNGQPLQTDAPLFPGGAEVVGEQGLTDVLAAVPQTYPTAGSLAEPDRYTVLLVPDWQVVEALRRLSDGHPDAPMPTAGLAPRDGVAWLLSHPELLFVQVPGPAEAADGGVEPWLDLAEALRRGRAGAGHWGYTVGLLAGRSPIALISAADPGWAVALDAQRALPHALTLASAGVVLLLVAAGLRRLPELWLPLPEERADYWPGGAPPEGDEGEGINTNLVAGGP